MTKFVVKTVLNNVIQDKKGDFTYSEKLRSIKWADPGDIAMKEKFDLMNREIAEKKLKKHKLKNPLLYDAKKGV